MKKTALVIWTLILCALLFVTVSADYQPMALHSGASVFFLDKAEKPSVRLLGSNPFDIEKINVIYVESGSKCSFGGQDGFAMPPNFIRVNYVSGTKNPMSNPVYCGSPFSVEVYDCTVDELFAHAKITKGKIKDLDIPKGLTLGGLVRDGVGQIINGDTEIKANDRVLIICVNDILHKIEKLFG